MLLTVFILLGYTREGTFLGFKYRAMSVQHLQRRVNPGFYTCSLGSCRRLPLRVFQSLR